MEHDNQDLIESDMHLKASLWKRGDMLKGSLHACLAFIVMLALAMSSLYAVFQIKRESVTENVERSCIELSQMERYPMYCGFKLWQKDNYTDAMMLHMMNIADDTRPFRAMLAQDVHRYVGDVLWDPIEMAKSEESPVKRRDTYARYWHGYQVFLRPLLTLTDYAGIRLLNVVLLSLFSVSVIWLLWLKIGKMAALSFMGCLLVLNPFIIPLCMQFSVCFYLAFIFMIVVLCKPCAFRSAKASIPLFFVIGAATSFFDFLTTPLLTWGLTIMTLLLCNREMRTLKVLIALTGAWCVGYGAFWAAKWLIAQVFLDEDVIGDAIHEIRFRSSDVYRGKHFTLLYTVEFIAEQLKIRHLVLPLIGGIVVSAVGVIVYFLKFFDARQFKPHFYLLLIAAGAPIWFLATRNHSFQHGWFTWRALLVSLWAMSVFVMSCTRLKKGKE